MVAGDYPETVLKTVDKYVPKSQCFMGNRHLKSEEQLSSSYISRKNPPSIDENYSAE